VSAESQERRRYPRIDLLQAVRIRPFDPSLPPEYCTTLNASEDGLYFPSRAGHYELGMSVYVTTDFQPDSPLNSTFVGVVVRIDKLESDKRGIAIHVLSPSSVAVN
jgi:PilZ domain